MEAFGCVLQFSFSPSILTLDTLNLLDLTSLNLRPMKKIRKKISYLKIHALTRLSIIPVEPNHSKLKNYIWVIIL